jgi:hypothetical protein
LAWQLNAKTRKKFLSRRKIGIVGGAAVPGVRKIIYLPGFSGGGAQVQSFRSLEHESSRSLGWFFYVLHKLRRSEIRIQRSGDHVR